jgi:outer membrane protein TolC
MRKILIITTLLAVSCSTLRGQESIQGVLEQIEANNKTLTARASLAEAEALEARVGNSLADPKVQLEHVWGTPAELGKQGELTATQSFDFPSAYIARNRLAKMRGKQAASDYDLYRQQVLLEAQELCFEVIALRRQKELLTVRKGFATRLAEISEKQLEVGDTNILEVSEARVQALSADNYIRLLDVEIADALGRLKILNGGIEVDFTDTEFPPVMGLAPFDEMAEIYLESDPALAGALARRDVAQQGVKAARSESLPKFELGYKLEFAAGERFNGLVAGMSIPMFGNRNNVKRARAEENFALLEAENAQMSTERELATLYDKASILEESIRSYEKITIQSELYLKNLARSLEAGELTVTDYFSQYDGMLNFEKELIELTKQYHIVRSRIDSVTL